MLREKTLLLYVVALRLFVGYYFLGRGLEKLWGVFGTGLPLVRMLGPVADKHPISWYKDFLASVVMPNEALFSYVISLGETLVGASLLVGLLVRLSSPFGVFINLNYYLAFALTRGGAQIGLNGIFILCHLIFFLSGAGRVLGLDGVIRRKLPGSKLF